MVQARTSLQRSTNYHLILTAIVLFFGCAASRFQISEAYVRQQNWPKAQQSLEELIRENPRDGEAHLLLAEVYAKQGRISQMLTTLDKVKEFSPHDRQQAKFIERKYWIENFKLGLQHFAASDFNAAVIRFQAAVKIDSSNIECVQRLADALFMTARYHEAEKAYSVVLKHAPKNPIVKNNLAEIYFIKKDYQRAIAFCDEILALKENDLNALTRRAYAYDALGEFSQAEADFKAAAVLNPTPQLLTDFGLLYFKNEEYHKAIDMFQKALPQALNKHVLLHYLGEANWRIRDYQTMAGWYRKLVESQPANLLAWKNLAVAYEALGQQELLAQARQHIHRIISTN